MDHTRPELKYVDAKELNGMAARLDGASVVSSAGEKLGVVEGFILDVQRGQPRHVVVAAGWFIHKHFLLPIGHVKLDADQPAVIADVSKARIEGTPGFNKTEFEGLTDAQLDDLDGMMAGLGMGRTPTTGEDPYRLPSGWE